MRWNWSFRSDADTFKLTDEEEVSGFKASSYNHPFFIPYSQQF